MLRHVFSPGQELVSGIPRRQQEVWQELRITGKVLADPVLATVLKEIIDFRENLQKLLNYDWVSLG